jgi:hypothetical protein
MEHSDCNVHYNHMKLGITCCFVCFMITGCAFMEMGEERRFVSIDLECELSCLYEFGFSSSNGLVGMFALIRALNYWRMRCCKHTF